MSFLYEKSRTWRWIVASSKASKGFFLVFSTLCIGLPLGLGYLTMAATSSNDERLREQIAKTGRQDGQLMARVNKERLAQLLREVKEKENTEDRYAAALRGETLTGTPNARIRGGGGTSWKPLPPETPDVNKKNKESSAASA